MTEFTARTTRLALVACCAALALPGCASLPALPWQKVPLDTSAGFYQSASLTYRLDAAKLQQPLDVARVAGHSISFEQVASSPLPDQSVGTLTITSPHPGGRAGFAQARFTLDSTSAKSAPAKSWNPWKKKPVSPATPNAVVGSQPEIHETWVLDIPLVESDSYFKLLSTQSFYNGERPGATGAARISVDLNGSRASKNWDQLPELNALVQRVRRDGQLVAYSRPGALAGNEPRPITNVRAYEGMLSQLGPGAAPPSGATNPFAVVPPPPMSATAINPAQIARQPGLAR